MRVALMLAAVAVGALAGSGAAAETKPAKPAKKPAIVVRDFRFLGFGKDVVGATSERPDGVRDAHFRIVVASRGGAWRIGVLALEFCPPNQCTTKPSSIPWATTRSTGKRLGGIPLGVLVSGKRFFLDARRRSSGIRLPRSGKGVKLDLYANDGPGCLQMPGAPAAVSCKARGDDRRFGPGIRFRMRVNVSSSPKTSRSFTGRWLKLPGTVQNPKQAVALGNFRYVGLDRDVAGATLGSPPDGKLDAHFRLDVTPSNGPGYLWGMTLSRAEPSWHAGGWSTTHAGPALTAFLDGDRLDLAGNADGDRWKTWVDLAWSSAARHLDVYVHNFGPDSATPLNVFAPGARFKVMVFVIVPNYVPGQTAGGSETTLTLPGG